jgi:hypothetical protein
MHSKPNSVTCGAPQRTTVSNSSWLKRQAAVPRYEHRAGEKLFIDYAGDTIAVHDRCGPQVLDQRYAASSSSRQS